MTENRCEYTLTDAEACCGLVPLTVAIRGSGEVVQATIAAGKPIPEGRYAVKLNQCGARMQYDKSRSRRGDLVVVLVSNLSATHT